ncbi:MAG: hypothetical protein WCP17_02955 [bacterium]
MKKNFLIVLCIVVCVIVLIVIAGIVKFNFSDSDIFIPKQENSFNVTEKFTGDINGKAVIFEQADYVNYRLTIDGVVKEGDLNTERGFRNDENATVYVLDWKKPETEQKYYVRLSNDSTHIQLLDSNRNIIPGELLKSSEIIIQKPITCTPSWQCGWGSCNNGYQGMTAIDSNNCGLSSANLKIVCPALARECK